MSYKNVILLLGSNINNPENNIQIAIEKIEKEIGCVLNKSELIKTKAVEFDSINNFCNIVIKLSTILSPIKLLLYIKKIESDMGRVKDSSFFGFYQDRIIDIDIVLYNDLKFISRKLNIPHHKNLYERNFARELIKQVK